MIMILPKTGNFTNKAMKLFKLTNRTNVVFFEAYDTKEATHKAINLADHSKSVRIDEIKERIEFTKISCNHAGHPRYVVHFLNFLTAEELKEIRLKYPDKIALDPEYNAALKKARKIGGRKFHNKQYGGGIVFAAFDTYELEFKILKLKNA